MNKQNAWDIFEKSGRIEDYLVYKNISTENAFEGRSGEVHRNGKNKDINGWADDQGTEYR